MPFLDDLKQKILVADGAIGTLLYSYGIGHCFEELNISHPDQVEQVHRAYLQAGAQVLQTNTYGANYEKLLRYGLEDQVKEINRRAVQIVKSVVQDEAYILGTIGGIRGVKKKATSLSDIKAYFMEQVDALLTEGVDGILLETYYDLEELKTVLSLARSITPLPIVAQVSLHEIGILQDGIPIAQAFQELEELGANVVGLNCRQGPYHMIRSFEEAPLPSKALLSAYPMPAYLI